MSDEIPSLEGVRNDIHDMKVAIAELATLVRSQEKRISALEKPGVLSATRETSRETAPTPSTARVEEGFVPVPPPYAPPSVSTPTVSTSISIGEWFGVDWPMKVGALLILLGFGWFVSYAFANNWIGPVGRITLGVVAGAAILVLGYARMRHSTNQGSVFFGLGTAIILLTVFAAREIYDFFTPLLALVFMSLVVVFTAYSSVIFRSRALAFVSLVAGGVAPLLTAGESNFLGLFSYLFCLSAGMLWVVRLTAWRALTLASLGIVAVYSLPFITSSNGAGVERGEALLVAFSFAGLFFLTGLLGMFKDRLVDRYDLFVVALNGFLLLGWIHAFVPSYLQSVVTAGAAVIFSVAAFVVYRATGISAPVTVYSGNAALFLTVATAYELSGAAFVIALAFEVGLIVSGSVVLLRNMTLAKKLGLFLILPIVFSFEALEKYASFFSGRFRGDVSVFTEDFFAIFSIFLVSGLLALLYRTSKEKSSENKNVTASQLLLALSTLYAVFLVWFSLQRAIDDADMAAMCALILFTLLGIGFYLKGRLSELRDLQVFGSTFLIGVAVRLLVVEVWQMDIFGRIITFFVIGALFMSTAFLGKKKPSFSGVLHLLLFFSLAMFSFFFGQSALAVGEYSASPDLSPYEYVKNVPIPPLSVPTVVDVPISDPRFQRGGFVVYEETTRSLQSVGFLMANEAQPTKFLVSASVNEGSASSLVDGDTRTEAEFFVGDDQEGRTSVRLSSPRDVSLSGVMLDLAPHVSLPKTIEVRIVRGGVEKIALAQSTVSSRTIRFPEETATEWIFSFSYSQPLRIREISFFEERAQFVQARSLRFLARPRESYKIFFGADRNVSISLGEASNFSDNRDVLRLIEPETITNTFYVPADTDQDGVRDLFDNCVGVSNPDQSDQNGNGRGDVCDDYDKDGILNSMDNCPDHPNRAQTDTDGDGKGDTCDTEESRITEKYAWLPWVALVAVGALVSVLLIVTVRRERNA